MAIQYLKKAAKQPTSGEADTRRIVGEILDNIRAGGEQRVRSYAAELDKWQGDIVVSPEAIAAAGAKVPARLKQDIDRSEEHTSELQSLMRISYAVFCLKKKTHNLHKQSARTTPSY